MDASRRSFLRKGAGVTAGALIVLGATEGCTKRGKSKMMVGACGICCSTCPLMKAKKCKGCGPGNDMPEKTVKKKNCPVLNCASMKKIAYCGTDCKKFTECSKLIGRPYDKSFMEKIKTKLG